MTTVRHISAKKAWARLQDRAEHGEKFGFIACLGVIYKAGILNRDQVLEHLRASQITREDLQKFREHCDDAGGINDHQSGSLCTEVSAVSLPADWS